MGFHKKIRDHGPIVYYTFDPKETYGDTYTGIGVFGNKVETEFPPLTMNNTGLTFIYDRLDFISPSLAKIEKFALYKSASTGAPRLISDMATTPNGSNPVQVIYNNHSMCYEATFSEENLEDMKSGEDGIYTIFFQVNGYPVDGASATQYANAFNEHLEPRIYFGTGIHCQLTTNRTFDEDIVSSFGVSSELVGENLIKATCSFGFHLNAITPHIKAWNLQQEFSPHVPIMFYKNVNYHATEMNKDYFKFGIVRMEITSSKGANNTNPNYSLNFSNLRIPGVNNSVIRTFLSDEVANVFLEVNENENKVKIWFNKTFLGEYDCIRPDNYYNLQLGYKSHWTPLKDKADDIFEVNESRYLRRANFPVSVVTFDNFAIFNKTFTEDEKIELMDSNTPYEEFYEERYYKHLYDFKDVYSKYKRLLENNTSIPNIFGTSNLTVYCSNTKNLPYVEYLQSDPRLDHYLVLRKNASLQSNRNTWGRPTTLMSTGGGSLTFMFKTIDGDGVLFFNGKYEFSPRNIMLLFSYDYLEIWHGKSLYGRISGLNNNEWHYIDIVYTPSLTKIYIDDMLYHDSIETIANDESLTGFGNCLPGNTGLDVELAMIGFASTALDASNLKSIKTNRTIYSASGQVTLNNIAIGTNVFVYNRDTGELIEKLTTSNENGIFTYYNKTPNTLSIIVADSTLTQGSSYIVDPVELQ